MRNIGKEHPFKTHSDSGEIWLTSYTTLKRSKTVYNNSVRNPHVDRREKRCVVNIQYNVERLISFFYCYVPTYCYGVVTIVTKESDAL